LRGAAAIANDGDEVNRVVMRRRNGHKETSKKDSTSLIQTPFSTRIKRMVEIPGKMPIRHLQSIYWR
jgi:hypothetical protein